MVILDKVQVSLPVLTDHGSTSLSCWVTRFFFEPLLEMQFDILPNNLVSTFKLDITKIVPMIAMGAGGSHGKISGIEPVVPLNLGLHCKCLRTY